MSTDARRKLQFDDYSKIRLYLGMNYTIREVASIFNCSTKYIKRVDAGEFTFAPDGSVSFTTAPDSVLPPPPEMFPCSGCGMSYGSSSGLSVHMSIWTSGGTKALECAQVMSR